MTNSQKKATTRRKTAASKNEDPPVYLLSMEVENLLCFKERQKLNLSNKDGHPAQWTVILGNNGVGKTTLLRCLAGMEVSLKMSIPESNIFFPMLYTPSLFRSLEMWQDLQEVIIYKGGKINTKIAIGEMNTPIQNLEVQEAKISINGGTTPFSKGSQGLICYGYGATRRTGYGSFDDSYHHDHSESLFSDNASLMNAEAWLLETDYAVKSTSGKIHSRLQSEFKHIVEILKRILPDVQDIRITPVNEDYPRPRAEFLTPFGWVRLSSLGLGYRTMIAWMVDLAVRLFIRYPDSEDPLAEPAIVLVDEIDLHMHPQWQRTIMEFLTERFPNTQFIVTAHSPLVVQAAQDANIVLLRREGDRVVIDNNPEIIDNWRVDQVLTSVFEMPSARPAKIEPLLDRRQEILTKSKLTKADKAELQELEEKIGALPTAETSEDIKAMDIIHRAAKLLEKSSAEAVE